jgi:stage II sporulation protein D
MLPDRNCDIEDILNIQITKTSSSGRATELVITGSSGSKSYIMSSTRTVLGLSSQMYKISTDCDAYFYGDKGVKVKVPPGSKKVIVSKGLKTTRSMDNSNIVIGAKDVKKAISSTPSKYIFTGKGSGHAIGMSQEGAVEMAKEGYTYDQILKHYYTGVEIK